MRRIVVLELLCITALAAMIFAGCGGDGGGREMARPDNIETELAPIETAAADQARVIIGFKQPPGRAERQMVEGHGGNVAHVYTLIPAIAAKIPEQAVEGIRHNPNVAYVEGDPELRACQDELGWGADRINAETLWGSTEDAVDIQGRNDLSPYTGEGCVVAILDTGIDYTHPDLDDNYRSDLGSDYVNDDADPMDDNGHGTHCAGVVAAEDNELGMINVAPRASLVALKVLDANGVGYTSDVVAALDAAAQQSWGTGFRVCSMSFSGEHSGSLKKACGAAYNSGRGILLVAAAGDDAGAVGYPAAYDSVIAVSATDAADNVAAFSATGGAIELAAPGVEIKSTWLGGGYQTMSGTSVACAHVSGLATLCRSFWDLCWEWWGDSELPPPQDAGDVRAHLQMAAVDLGPPGLDDQYGHGLAGPSWYYPPTPYVWDISWAMQRNALAITVTVHEDGDRDSVPEATDAPLEGAPVSLNLSLDTGGYWSFDGTTDSAGQVTFVHKKPASGTYTAEARVDDWGVAWMDVGSPSTYTVP